MRAIGIITGVLLIFIVTPINQIAGYGYTFGGAIETIGTTDRDNMALAAGEDMHTLTAIKTLAATKLGLFGLLLQALAMVQFITGFLLIIKERVGSIFLSFLLTVALSGISAEIVGGVYTSSFGTTNIIGTVISVFVLIVGISMYLKTKKILVTTGN